MRLSFRLKTKLHHARVTKCDPDYIGSITMCPKLMQACGLVNGEQVHIWGVEARRPLSQDETNNQAWIHTQSDFQPPRITTYVFAGEEGDMAINGGGAWYFHEGQKIIVAAFDLSDEPIAPVMLELDETNCIKHRLEFSIQP